MQKLVTGMRNNQGFTLIEIMVVIVIIGITLGFALIAFGDFGESKRILFAAEQLVSHIKVAQQKAIIETTTLGLKINSVSYQIVELNGKDQWSPISNKGIFKPVTFPKDTVITLKTNHFQRTGIPEIIINSSGDLTPFTLNFGSTKEKQIAVLTGSSNGSLKFKAKGAP